MGLGNFKKFYNELLQKKDPKYFLNIKDLGQLEYNKENGKVTILFDFLQTAYKNCIGRLNSGQKFVDANGKSNLHIVVLFDYFSRIIGKYNINPIVVFDGKSPKEKKSKQIERQKRKEKASEKCKSVLDEGSYEYLSHVKKSFSLNREEINECKMLLELMGIPTIDAPEEADQQCAALSKHYNFPVATNDTDVLVSGGHIIKEFNTKEDAKLMVNISQSSIRDFLLKKANSVIIEEFKDSNEDYELLTEITDDNFVDWSILMGTDYNSSEDLDIELHINDLFKIFVLSGMSVRKTIARINMINGLEISEKFMEHYERIKEIYTRSDLYDPESVNISQKQINSVELYKFLQNHSVSDYLIRSCIGLLTGLQLKIVDCEEKKIDQIDQKPANIYIPPHKRKQMTKQ